MEGLATYFMKKKGEENQGTGEGEGEQEKKEGNEDREQRDGEGEQKKQESDEDCEKREGDGGQVKHEKEDEEEGHKAQEEQRLEGKKSVGKKKKKKRCDKTKKKTEETTEEEELNWYEMSTDEEEQVLRERTEGRERTAEAKGKEPRETEKRDVTEDRVQEGTNTEDRGKDEGILRTFACKSEQKYGSGGDIEKGKEVRENQVRESFEKAKPERAEKKTRRREGETEGIARKREAEETEKQV